MFRAENAQSLAGLGFVVAVCWALSENKRAFPWKLALGSIAVQIGGVSSLVPSRRKDFARFGLRAMIGGALATFSTAAVAGILL